MFKASRQLGIFLIIAAFSVAACDSTPEEAPEEESAVEEAAEEEEEITEEEEVAEEKDPLAAPADVAAPPEDAETTESGLASKVIKEGDGEVHPEPTSNVSVHYTGWTTDGEMFDSSIPRGAPTSFPLNQVIAGWTEGVQLMVEGETRRFWIPQDLAYQGRPGPPAGMLVFDVELIEIN